MEPDLGAASVHARPGHGGRAHPGGAVGGRAQRLSVAGAGHHGRLSGEDGGCSPPGMGAWRSDAARAAAPAAGGQPAASSEPCEEGAVGCADHGTLPARGGPIKHARLVAYEGDRVTMLYRSRHEEADGGLPSLQRMTLPVADFLKR